MIKNIRAGDLTFQGIIVLAGGFMLIFTAAAVGLVLIRGIPGLISSISSPEIQFSIALSLKTSAVSTLSCIIIAIPVAYGLSRYHFRGKTLTASILSIPVSLPPLVSGTALLLLFGTTTLGKELSQAGVEFVFTPLGIIAAQFFVNAPYMIKIMKSTLDAVDPRLEFVARTLGLNQFEAFWRVTLPMAKNGIIAGTVITFARGLGEFGAALMLAGATRMKTEILPLSIYLNISTGNLEMALAAASVLIIISVAALFIFEALGGSFYETSRNK